MLRIDAEQSLQSCADEFGAKFAKLLPQADAVVLSDYAKGTLCRAADLDRDGARSRYSCARRPEGHGLRALPPRVCADAEPGEFEAVVGKPAMPTRPIVAKGENASRAS